MTVGELGNGFFSFDCVSLTDGACGWAVGTTDVGEQERFPSCLALNSTFRLDYELSNQDALDDERSGPALFVEPASGAYVDRAEPFVALREGRAAMLARADEQVVDFIHFSVVSPDGVDLRDADGRLVSAIDMAVNEIRVLRVTARSSRCATVGGALPLRATSNDPSIVTASSTTGELLELDGRGLGEASVIVDLGLQTVEIPVRIDDVAPEPEPEPDSTTTDGATTGTGEPISDFPLDATATDGGATQTGGSTGGAGTDTTGGGA